LTSGDTLTCRRRLTSCAAKQKGRCRHMVLSTLSGSGWVMKTLA
jgi:hypothetical protein